MSSLQELPTELLEKILGNLGLEDLLACQLINPFFNDTIRNSVDLNYQLLLQRSGNLDNPHCRATILQKRNTLDNAEFLWSSRSFIPQKLFGEIRLTNHFRLTKLLGFTDRCLIYGAREADKDESITTHLIYTLNSSNIDNYHQNNGIGKEGKDWILPPPPHLQGSRVLGLATDIDENGVVISIHASPEGANRRTFEIYMVISDDHYPRPGNRRTRYLATTDLEWTDEIVSIDANVEISGENIAMVMHTKYRSEGVTHSSYDFAVVDWRTGRIKIKDVFLTMECQGLGFLTADHVLVPSLKRGSIDVFHIPRSSSSEGVDDSKKPCLKKIASFILPRLAEFNKFADIDIHCSPNSFNTHPTYTRPSVEHDAPITVFDNDFTDYVERPYVADAKKAIIAITMMVAKGEESTIFAIPRLFIHRQSLLEVLNAAFTLQNQTGAPDAFLTIPWDDWGPDRCRWTSVTQPRLIDGDPGSNLRKFCVYGQRYAVMLPNENRHNESENPEDSDKISNTHVAHLYDFNPYTPVIRLQNKRGRREEEWNGEIPEEDRQFTHSRPTGFFMKNHLISHEVVLPSLPDSPHSKFKFKDADVFNQGEDGSVVGKLGYFQYCIAGLPRCADIAIDARRMIQRELKDSTDIAIVNLFFG